ncbi:MAG: heme exporter protein CcmB [Devosiaceae bacterium]|nr:heme exporter protein CcmB [Devosiaceae bacterium MH13]
MSEQAGPFRALVARDLRLSLRVGGGALTGVLFFLAVITTVPFGVGPDLNLLARIGPAIMWIAALLATLIGLERLFQSDRDDGALDLLRLTDAPLSSFIIAKVVAHWLGASLPLVLATPVLSLLLALEPLAIAALTATLLVGTPALSFLGAVGAALAVTLRRGALLMAVIILPFSIPVLIFGVAATRAAVTEPDPFWPPFALLGAVSLIYAVVGTVGAAAAIRINDG